MRIAYLLPDTNLFVQCKPLSELDWSPWSYYDEIHIIVTRPVQKEIDKHKNRGNDRTASRSRKAANLFRKIISTETGYELIEKKDQTIKVFLELQHKPDKELDTQLDYDDFDDRLVGIAYAFVKEKADEQVWVVTHDTGPLASGKMVKVKVFEIPEDWLLEPEPSAESKKIARLEEKIRNLEQREPNIVLLSLDENGNEVGEETALQFEMTHWLPLTEDQLSELTSQIKSLFPMATDFQEPKPQGVASIESIMRFDSTYIPAAEEDITEYRQKKYPYWIKQCESILSNYHEFLQCQEAYPTCSFVGHNVGARPAEDVLVTFEAKGSFYLDIPERENDEKNDETVTLPPPPKPPKGVWRSVGDIFGATNIASSLLTGFSHELTPTIGFDPGSIQNDPNEFYWEERKPLAKCLSLECRQWRHGKENQETFEVAVFSNRGESGQGMLECRIEAANATSTTTKRLRVKIIWKPISVLEKAQGFVEGYVSRV